MDRLLRPLRRAPRMAALVVFVACATIAPFSQVAYEQATSLKAESLALMSKANEPYATHEREVQSLQLSVDKAYEYAKGRQKNEISTRQWDLMRDSTRNLLGGFLRRWKKDGTLGHVFVTEARSVISDAFDQIIGLESGKVKPSDVK